VAKGFRAASLDGEGFGTSDAKLVLKQKKETSQRLAALAWSSNSQSLWNNERSGANASKKHFAGQKFASCFKPTWKKFSSENGAPRAA
jgi:hypothetical protein